MVTSSLWVNALRLWQNGCCFEGDFSKSVFSYKKFYILTHIALKFVPRGLLVSKSALVQVMAWCRQATSHYLNKCWPRPMTPYGVTRPEWVEINYRFSLQSPMSNGWDNISPGLKVEVLNTDCDLQKEVYWVATVIKLAGELPGGSIYETIF